MNQFIKAIMCVLTIFIFFLSSLAFSSEIRADNLLLNSSFEDATNGMPNSWAKNVSTATLSTSSTAKTGTASASINKTNSTTGTIYLYQDVDIEPNSYYSLAGWVIKNDSKFSYSLLRISWRDASAEISKTDSSQLTSDLPTFQESKIDSVQAPDSSIKARIELLANISSPNPANPVLFDDISFSQVVAPEQPISTPIATTTTVSTPVPTAASIKTPTPVPTPTKTPLPSPTKTSTPSPSPIPEVLGQETGFSTGSADLLALRDSLKTEPPTQKPSSGTEPSAPPIIGGIFIGFGAILIGTAIFLGFKKRKTDTPENAI